MLPLKKIILINRKFVRKKRITMSFYIEKHRETGRWSKSLVIRTDIIAGNLHKFSQDDKKMGHFFFIFLPNLSNLSPW